MNAPALTQEEIAEAIRILRKQFPTHEDTVRLGILTRKFLRRRRTITTRVMPLLRPA